MWGNTHKSRRPSQDSRLNSTMPILPSSPMISRDRSFNLGLDHSPGRSPYRDGMASLLRNTEGGMKSKSISSPFMPQIKRALGLEPTLQNKYSEHRRHSFGMGLLPKAAVVSGSSLPHVKFNKTRRPSLTEKNSSMLNRSSTVKIAPPMMGKVASPSLYHLRCNTSVQEDRGTPDTYAVISALKERRKRSINAFEEQTELVGQQAKRRRQESQHSNASTSSMPSLPDNFPDIANPDFSMRLETPGLQVKRPSRPRQEDLEDWDNEQQMEVKRPRCGVKNNAIFSSLTSSRWPLESQKLKRKAETSFSEKENEKLTPKKQGKEPPKLTHLDIPQSNGEHSASTAILQQVKDRLSPLTNGHSQPSPRKEEDTEQLAKTAEADKPDSVRRLPSMKKTASVYSGLTSSASFKKAQYANVYATLEDYEADRRAEQQRVQQMLKDLDESFTSKQAKTVVSTTALTTTVATATTASISTLATTSVTTATVSKTASSLATSSSITSPALSALEKFTKSSIQETGGITSSTTLAGSTLSSGSLGLSTSQPTNATGSQPSLTGSAAPGFNFNLQKSTQSAAESSAGNAETPAIAGSVTTATTSQTPGGFSFGSTVSSAPQTSLGAISFGVTSAAASTVAGSAVPSGIVFGSATSSTTPKTTTPLSSSGFGLSQTTVTASSSTPGGFTFGTQATSAAFSLGTSGSSSGSTSGTQGKDTPVSGVSFGSAASSTAASTGLAGGSTGSTVASGGFNFGSTLSSASTGLTTSSTGNTPATAGFTFGKTGSSLSSGTGLTAGSAGSTPGFGGFNFGNTGASSSASTGPAAASTGSTSGVGGFNFGSSGSSVSATKAPAVGNTAGGFNFGNTGSSTSASTGLTTGSTGSTAFSFGGSSSVAKTTGGFLGQSTGSSTVTQSGLANTAGSAGVFGNTSTALTSGFSFGAKPTTTASAFGVLTSTSAQTPFGAPTLGTSQTPFGASTTGTLQAPFGTSAVASNSPFSFGATQTTTSATPFAFGAGSTNKTTASSTPFAFGVGSTAANTGSSQPATGLFQFGGAQSTAASAFGQTASVFGTTSQTPAFGSSSQTPAFGSSSQTPAFGSSGQTPGFGSSSQTPAFGSASQTPAFGFSSQTPAFGTGNQPAFGSANQQPAFGAQTNQPSAFGSATPTFGASANQKPATPAFGASTSSSVFGNNTTGFAKSHSMPVFSTVPDVSSNPGTFNFGGGGPVPNVNPFSQGQVTPAKQTGLAFGQTSNDMTPKAQTGSMFAFGQSNNNSSSSKGFDFSMSAGQGGAPNTSGFNFNATPSGTPNFGATPGSTPGAFSVGTGGNSAQRPPRPVARAQRRRPTRR